MSKKFEAQLKAYAKAKKNLSDLVDRMYPEGLILRWKDGKYKGRECLVRSNTWDDWNGGSISVVVKTRTQDGKGFIDYSDSFHRLYRDVDQFEIVT